MDISNYKALDSKELRLRSAMSMHGAVLFAPLLCWVAALISYARGGIHASNLLLWLLSMAGMAFLLYRIDRVRLPRISQLGRELIVMAGLLAVFVPAYTAMLYQLPQQVTSDELNLMMFERDELAQPDDPFGISSYAGFPRLPFIAFARAGEALGGVNLANIRLVHACAGVLIALLSYVFFRQLMPRPYAAGGALMLGFNHALWAISRLAQWDNLSLLSLLLAMILLIQVSRSGSWLFGFVGGAAAGLTWFVYPPARITVVIWGVFLAAIWLPRAIRESRVLMGRATLASALGLVMLIGPLMVATALDARPGSDYYRYQLLLFPEGRERQRQWVFAETIAEGVEINLIHGLTTFNGFERDHGNIYENRGHGFVDPLTGVLLWIGVFYTARRILGKGANQDGDLLCLIGFLTLWLTYSFITNQSPNYTRLLVVLPFVVYLVLHGLRRVAESPSWRRWPQPSWWRWAPGQTVFGLGVLAIVVWNWAIFGDYLQRGLTEGDVLGATGRYVEAHADDPGYSLHLFADKHHPYYRWGQAEQWKEWIGFFADDDQLLTVEPPQECGDPGLTPPFTAFMSDSVWEQCASEFAARFPSFRVRHILPSGTRLAVEVRG